MIHTETSLGMRLIAIPAALLMTMALLLVAGPGTAGANEEKQFCYGKNLPYGGGCSSATYPDLYAVYANSPNGVICAHLSVVDGEDRGACSAGANTGIYVGYPMGESHEGHALITNMALDGTEKKVYGTFWRKAWSKDNLGGEIQEEPEIASSSPGYLNVFMRGTNNYLHLRDYSPSGWSGWVNLGGPQITSSPGAVSWGPGRMEVVARATNGSVAHWWYDGSWHNDNLGGEIIGSPDMASSGSGYADVYMRGTNDYLHVRSYSNATGWNAWQNLGGPQLRSGPSAVSWGSNRVDVVARVVTSDPNKTEIGHWWYDGSWHFEYVPRSWGFVGDPTIASTGFGNLEVFAKDQNGLIYHLAQRNQTWSPFPWKILPNSAGVTSAPNAVSWNPYRFDVVARGSNGSVDHWWWDQ